MEKQEPTENVKEKAEEYEPPVPWDEPDISHDDSTPPIKAQAEAQGWKSEYYDFGKVEGQGWDLFNPGLVQRPDGLWLLVRVSEPHPEGFKFGQNNVFAFMLDADGKVPKMGKRLNWPVDEPRQHFEDPRGFYHPGINQTVIGVCTFLWYPMGTWTGPHQALGMFDEDWQCKKMDYPRVAGHNLGRMEKINNHKHYEKNWLFFLHDGRLTLLYKANPWMVVHYGHKWGENERFELDGVTWAYGEIRGGTTPVKVGDYYFTFHHSSLPWRGRYRRYYAGCIAFDAKPPFTPRLITSEPLLHGSQNDRWAQRKPLVIFPCGSNYKDGKWLVTCGVNDIKSAWVELSHESLLSKMRPIGDVSDTIFGSNGLSEGERNLIGEMELETHQHREEDITQPLVKTRVDDVADSELHSPAQTTLEKRRAALVKARAVMAAKRIQRDYIPDGTITVGEMEAVVAKRADATFIEKAGKFIVTPTRKEGDAECDVLMDSSGGTAQLAATSSTQVIRSEAAAKVQSRKRRRNFSPQALENLRAGAARARSARMARRTNAISIPTVTDADIASIKPKKRRRKKYRRITSEARMKALKEYEAKKNQVG